MIMSLRQFCAWKVLDTAFITHFNFWINSVQKYYFFGVIFTGKNLSDNSSSKWILFVSAFIFADNLHKQKQNIFVNFKVKDYTINLNFLFSMKKNFVMQNSCFFTTSRLVGHAKIPWVMSHFEIWLTFVTDLESDPKKSR